jgi:hypothetical protein
MVSENYTITRIDDTDYIRDTIPGGESLISYDGFMQGKKRAQGRLAAQILLTPFRVAGCAIAGTAIGDVTLMASLLAPIGAGVCALAALGWAAHGNWEDAKSATKWTAGCAGAFGVLVAVGTVGEYFTRGARAFLASPSDRPAFVFFAYPVTGAVVGAMVGIGISCAGIFDALEDVNSYRLERPAKNGCIYRLCPRNEA